jgi:hypothetical protein
VKKTPSRRAGELASRIVLVALVTASCADPKSDATCAAISPDGRWAALLVERNAGPLDRQFEVRLERRDSSHSTIVFTSPDEGRPVGTERFIWSGCSDYFLLVGRRFFVITGTPVTADGEDAYLLHQVSAGLSWCNARQQSGLPPIRQSHLVKVFGTSVEWEKE